MLITLKQHEIVAALRLYVATNGINLAGKTLDVAFTAGRKESGLSAEVSIEDDGSKALDPVQAVAPVLTSVTPVTMITDPSLTPIPASIATVLQEAEAPAVEPAPAPAPSVTSLFG